WQAMKTCPGKHTVQNMPVKAIHQFPQGFLWGCATAAHQVEGQNVNDWWRWEQTPGHIFENQKAGRACDWWAGRFVEDFDRAADMRNNAQRISIEWSRVEPEPEKWDDYALGRYRDMLQALVERGMQPMVTLHHFTNPLWLADHDGWLWDEAPKHFQRYVSKVVDALGDLCSMWCTMNEPSVYTVQGYSLGKWPPGIKNRKAVNRVTLNQVRGHAAAYKVIKAMQPGSQVGFSTHHIGFVPSVPAILHRPARYLADQLANGSFIRAVKDGVVPMVGGRSVAVPEGKGTLDWIGLQYYREMAVGFTSLSPSSLFIGLNNPPNMPLGPKDWGGLNPSAIFGHIRWLCTTLKKPIYVTESGVPDPTDTVRPGYLIETVRALWQAANYNFPSPASF